MFLDRTSEDQLRSFQAELEKQLQQFKDAKLNLDLTRGKPSSDQLDLSNELDGILQGNYRAADGTDARNYGGLDGLPEAKALFSQVLGVSPEETLIGGNASLTLMYQTLLFALNFGFNGPASAWKNSDTIKFLCPVPGYDRHFTICEEFGIEMVNVAMTPSGPDMDEVERLVQNDASIKGIWCVPRFSNPTGVVFSDETVKRIAALGKIAGDNFIVMWDNAYALHTLRDGAPELLPVMDEARQSGTEDSVFIFGSTSKITFAGAGLAFMGASKKNLAAFKKYLGASSIGPDKVNQLRHVKFFNDLDGLKTHMQRHQALLAPRFDVVLEALQAGFNDSDMGQWTVPEGGYFISFDARPGVASAAVKLAAEAGVKLTPAGATFPYGKDPHDRNLRIAPSFPTLAELKQTMEIFVVCVKLASVRQKLAS